MSPLLVRLELYLILYFHLQYLHFHFLQQAVLPSLANVQRDHYSLKLGCNRHWQVAAGGVAAVVTFADASDEIDDLVNDYFVDQVHHSCFCDPYSPVRKLVLLVEPTISKNKIEAYF